MDNVQFPVQSDQLLDQRLAELEKTRRWSPRLIAKLESLITAEDPWANYRVNPLDFAAATRSDEAECLDLFMHAAKLDIYRLEWRMVCPHCGDTVESFSNLSGVNSECNCTLCSVSTKAHLDDYVQSSFSLSPNIRQLPFHQPEALDIDDFYFKYRLDARAKVPGGNAKIVQLREMTRNAIYIAPGATETVTLQAQKGQLLGHDMTSGKGFLLAIDEPNNAGNASVHLTNSGWSLHPDRVAPGNIELRVENQLNERAAFTLMYVPPGYQHDTLVYDRALTGNRVLNTQSFRDLFREERVASSEGIGVKDLTLVFTDLKGSTELYDRIGDLKAFTLVQGHFVHLNRAIADNKGAVVKTIGDAVMASFDTPANAMKAALQMLQELATFNRTQQDGEVLLKIGIHRGASIAVTLNERLDYFGQTVNIAARVQGLAGADEICLTEDFYQAPGVIDALGDRLPNAEDANLKGISKTMKIYRLPS